MDEMGLTTCDRDERIELMVSAADRPPLEPGGLRESIEVLPRVFCDIGLIWLYGMDLT